MSHAVMRMPAPPTMYAAVSSHSSASAASTIAASPRHGRGAVGDASSGADDTVAVQVQVRELAVGVGERHLHRAVRPAAAAADLGDGVFEALGQHDLRARRLAGGLVEYRLAVHLDVAVHAQPAAARVDVDLEVDLGEHRLV